MILDDFRGSGGPDALIVEGEYFELKSVLDWEPVEFTEERCVMWSSWIGFS